MSEEAVVEPVEPSEAVTDFETENATLKEKIRKMDETIKRNFDDAENWRKHQDSLKSEQERTASEIAEAKRVAEESARELAIYKAIAKHQLTEDHAELLQGVDVDQIETRAAKLASLIGDSKPDPFPKADPSMGPKGGGKASAADMFADFASKKL